MKYLIALILGIVTGIALFAAGLYYNPVSRAQSVSPLMVADQQQFQLNFSAVPGESVLYTNDGESVIRTHPSKISQLRDETLRRTRVTLVQLDNSRGEPVGFGIKFASDSEDTRVLNSEAIVDSAWHVFLPDRGTLLVGQKENHWSYIRDVVLQARLNSADSWRGNWNRVMTIGPNAIGTGRVFGGNGEFAGLDSEAVESLIATAFSSNAGPVAMNGSLAIALPNAAASQTE